ncbi:GH32 C-terminal domain-containing protein [Corynebacterium flavescens]|uniref:GH32 C-terminal domain-containing protein n=1 Tax=Corynebacterium flavescens TaxID=28028 RepID=UPI003FD0E06C
MTIHRPELHFVPETGILEAPAGVLLDGHRWQLFFQYKHSPDSASRWGHSYSEEQPFDWLECDDVLAPAGGELSLRAGSVAAGVDSINLYFTSVTSVSTSVRLARFPGFDHVCEVSDAVDELDPHVVRYGEVAKPTTDYKRFRSPSVVPDWAAEDREEGHRGWLMLALTGHSEAPVPVILRSPDGVAWNFEGPLELIGDPEFLAGEVPATSPLPPVVSPRIIRLRDEIDGRIYDVLLVTLERNHRDVSGYLVGYLEGTQFRISTGFRRIDFGHDFSRPRNTNFTEGTFSQEQRFDSAILFGLLNGGSRLDDPTSHPTFAEEGWANSLSLPRRVTLQGGKLFQTPVRGLPDAVQHSDRARSWTGLLHVPADSAVRVSLVDDEGNPAAIITHSGETLSLDRSMGTAFDGYFADCAPARAELAEGDSDSLTIIVDGATVEVFADGGQVAMASRVYFPGGCSKIEVETTNNASVEQSWQRTGSKV